jgi:hypothetical protein
MRIAIGIALFIAALFCITGSIPNILSDVIVRPEFVLAYVIGLGLLYASSREFHKQYFTFVIGLAALIAGLHIFLIFYLLGRKDNVGILIGCIYILIAFLMALIFFRNSRIKRISD